MHSKMVEVFKKLVSSLVLALGLLHRICDLDLKGEGTVIGPL